MATGPPGIEEKVSFLTETFIASDFPFYTVAKTYK